MAVWARSDLASVSISAAHGGVAHVHTRPVVDGAPAKIWVLDCDQPGCEDFLRTDPCWSSTVTEIPETYDETKAREQAEKSGALDRERQLADTMIELRQLGQLPDVLGQVLDRILGTPAALSGVLECGACGHGQPPGAKFCNECAAPMSSPVAKAALPGPQRPAVPPAAESFPSQGGRAVRLQDLRLDELQAACRARSLPDAGVRKELMKRLRTAGVSNADLQHLLTAA